SDWKTMVLKNASLGVRLGYNLPPPTDRPSVALGAVTHISKPYFAPTAAADVAELMWVRVWILFARSRFTGPSTPPPLANLHPWTSLIIVVPLVSSSPRFSTARLTRRPETLSALSGPAWISRYTELARIPTPASPVRWSTIQILSSPKAMVTTKVARVDPDSVVNYESLELRQHQITMHGRI
ncbi:hypothetical protein BGZ96_003454, partial [Linnemannia gamsii]